MAIIFWTIFEYFSVVGVAPSGQAYTPFIPHTVSGWEWKSALIYLAIGLVGAVFGQLGDLAASRIKRAIGVKDYGKIFPGHGGILDRFDSQLLVVPFTVLYLYVTDGFIL